MREAHNRRVGCRTGDYSDVKVIDADGREIPWSEVSHFDNDAMWGLMRQ